MEGALTSKVGELECQIANPARSPTLADRLEELIDLTNEVFPGRVCLEKSIDPDYPGTVHVLFRVACERRPEIDDLIDKEVLWHGRVREIAPDSIGRFRLLVK